MEESVPAVQVSEMFGVTMQGEGPDIGRACFFIRLHNCPVQCPGCDTAYSWDGTERGEKKTLDDIKAFLDAGLEQYPWAGIVVSGGEPLLHFRNRPFRNLIYQYKIRTWTALETSGFVKPRPITDQETTPFQQFLTAFTTVSLSPKITPCLHGEGWTDEQLLVNVPAFFAFYSLVAKKGKFVLKFVVRDGADIEVVQKFCSDNAGMIEACGCPVYLMPYGQEREEILLTSEMLIKTLGKTGFILSPRLHSILWGKRRGV